MPLVAPRSSLGVSLLPSLKEVLARNAARPVSRQRKKYRSGLCQPMFSFSAFAPPKGGERPAALTPQRGLAGWLRTSIVPRCRSLIGSFGPRAGLVPLRQTFVRRCQAGAATMTLRFSSLRRGLLLVAVNHEKGEPHKHSETLGFI